MPMVRTVAVLDAWSEPYNGMVVAGRRFVAELRKRGHEVTVLAEGASGPDIVGFPRLRGPIVTSVTSSMRFPLARPNRTRIDEVLNDADLVHVYCPFFLGRSTIRGALKLGKPIVSSFLVQPENVLMNVGLDRKFLAERLYQLWITQIYNRTDAVICPNDYSAEMLQSRGLTAPIEVISNGVPVSTPLPGEPRGDLFEILCISRLAPEKRQETLIDAIATSRSRAGTRLSLVGAGPRQAQLAKHASERGVRLAHIGPATAGELADLLRQADLVVHTSEVELEGLVVLEAMAAGKVVLVAEAASSAASSLIAPHPRVLFPARSVGELADSIDYWSENPAERTSVAEANRQRAAEFDVRASVDAVEKLYLDLACRSTG